MSLSGRERKELQEALIDAFPNTASLEQMLTFELDKSLKAIAGEGSLQDIVFRLIQTANAQGWVEDLICAAYKSNPGNQRLKIIVVKVLTNDAPETTSNSTPKSSHQPQKILILVAIPQGLRLDKEIREIEEAIRRATNRDLFEIRIRTAVRPQDIRRSIAEEQPSIVHFCGHGLEDGSLLLEDDGGNNKPVAPSSLASLFKLHADYVQCVLLNACYSEETAVAISQYINYVIGMNNPIQDSAAIEFAKGFYDGVGYKIFKNQDVFQRAFDEGMVAIEMEGISEHLTPILISNNKAKSTHIESSSSEQVSLVPQHEYELLVKNLLQSRLIENIPGKDLEVRHNACYTGKSGYEHQIGVSAEMKIAGVRFLILVDCKNHSKLVEANEVLEIASRIEDIGAQKGIIVTTRGFQSGAIQLAKSKGVALIIACDLKWEIYAENIGRDISLRQNFIRKGLRLLQRTTKLDENRLSVLYAQSAECRRGRIVSRFNSATNLDVMGRVTHAYVFVTNSVINGDVEINQITKRFTLENDQFFVLLRDGIFSFIALTTLWSWLALPLPFSNVLGVLNEFRIFLESLRKGDFKQAIELLRQMKNLDSQNWNWWEITNWGWLEIAHALETPECFDKTLKLAHQGEIRDHELIRLIIMIAKRGRYNQVISLANCIQDVWISSSDLDRLIIMIAEKGEYDPAIALTKSIKFELFSNQKRALILGRIASKIAKTGNLVKAANLFGESLQICQENWDGAMSQTSGDFLETNLSRLPKQNEVLIDIVFLATEANLIVQAIQSIKSEKFQAEIIAKITQKVNLIVANPEI